MKNQRGSLSLILAVLIFCLLLFAVCKQKVFLGVNGLKTGNMTISRSMAEANLELNSIKTKIIQEGRITNDEIVRLEKLQKEIEKLDKQLLKKEVDINRISFFNKIF